MVDLNSVIMPKSLTQPTAQEYAEAYTRLQQLHYNMQIPEQILRDMHTIQWYYWNLGWEKGRA